MQRDGLCDILRLIQQVTTFDWPATFAAVLNPPKETPPKETKTDGGGGGDSGGGGEPPRDCCFTCERPCPCEMCVCGFGPVRLEA